tara:strand:- start:3126 stop:4133 length:1008 start_codon:yes stop_codon:yes gene_type:complete
MSSEFRSGSALASCILNAHSDVALSTDVIKYWLFCYNRNPFLNKKIVTNILKEVSNRIYIKFSINLDIETCLNQIGNDYTHPKVYAVLANNIYNSKSTFKIVGENECLSWKFIPFFLENINNSKSLMIIRDPRDVLVSFKKHTIVSGNNYLVSIFNSLSLMQSWRLLEKKYPSKFLGVKYLDIKNNPKDYAIKVSNFLGIDYQENMLNEKNWKVRSGNGWKKWENKKSSSFINELDNPMLSNPIGRWRKIIDPVDHFISEWVTGEYLDKFGFNKEFDEFSPEIYRAAIQKLTSTSLLKKCLHKFIYHKIGSEEYPKNPFKSENWDRRYIENINEI